MTQKLHSDTPFHTLVGLDAQAAILQKTPGLTPKSADLIAQLRSLQSQCQDSIRETQILVDRLNRLARKFQGLDTDLSDIDSVYTDLNRRLYGLTKCLRWSLLSELHLEQNKQLLVRILLQIQEAACE